MCAREGPPAKAGTCDKRRSHLGAHLPTGPPNQKPLCAISQLVSTFALDDAAILDPFCGNGTTLVAARNLGRRAVGIEIDERYCEPAARRLSQPVFDFAGHVAGTPEQLRLTYE